MRRFALLVLAALALPPGLVAADATADPPAPAATEANPAASSGMIFAITLVSSDGEKNEDVLIFDGTTLSSQGYLASRFQPTAVTINDRGGSKSFQATMISPRGAEAIWSGTITGDAIEGKVLTGVKGRFDVSKFTGSLKK